LGRGLNRNCYLQDTVDIALEKLKRLNYPWTRREMESDDLNYHELKSYHDAMAEKLDSIATEKLSAEVVEVIDVEKLKGRTQVEDDTDIHYSWSKSDEEKLNHLTALAKTLKPPQWPWNAPDDSRQGKYNHSRMQFLVTDELKYRILNCPQCGVRALLVGSDQVKSEKCIDCLEIGRKKASTKKMYEEEWAKVRPADELPKEELVNGAGKNETARNLPNLNAAEQAVIALVQPVVTVKKNFVANKKYRQECINLLHHPQKTWCKILPRKELENRFVVIERRFKDATTRYMIADPEKVRVWLRYLFKNHEVYMRKLANRELELSEEALEELERQSELASVDYDGSLADNDVCIDDTERPPPSAELDAGLSKTELYCIAESDHLYLKKQHSLKVTNSGKIEMIKDDDPIRQAVYDPHISANIAFPHLYPNGEGAPMDCGQHTLARYLLKKQSQFAQKAVDGKLYWSHSEHGVHMMHQYARLVEMNVRALVGWYISQKPESAYMPLNTVIDAFREGMSGKDQGVIDSKFPGLQGIMAQIRNTREKWFYERQGIEAVSRDLGDANLFMTLNCDPRAWPDVRKLLYELNEGEGKEMPDDYYELDTEKFTKLLDKYATQVAVYLNKKVKLFLRAFLCDICRIPKRETGSDVADKVDRIESGWFWSRVEFTSTRGVQHWHTIAKLPGVLDTGILSRMIANMRVVREELKYKNILDYSKAWTIIKCGLLASRYLVLLANSLSTCSFFNEDLDNDHYDESKVIDLDVIRSQYVENYQKKVINKSTHPIMRQFNDKECDENKNVEMAKVAAVSCMHNCIQNVCGGDERTGKGCRFDFPKKLMKCTVPAIMEVGENQMEVQMVMRRTNGRIPNLNKYLLQYWRANHDCTLLVDSAHKMRYATKYVSKGGQISVLLNEIIEHLEQKSASSVVAPTVKQALTQFLLADCSNRTMMSKQELAYKVMDLPQIRRNFTQVKTVAHYPRAVVIEEAPHAENGVIELSDRTEYSAYSERCFPVTVTKGKLTKDELIGMNLSEFAENVGFKWIVNRKSDEPQCQNSSVHENNNEGECDDEDTERTSSRLKWRCRDRRSGYWSMWRKRKSCHIKPSTLLYTDLARNYMPMDGVSRFFDLPADKRNQLKRVYQEIVCYVPWQDSPDKTFLSNDVIAELATEGADPDSGSRYSLKMLEEYYKVYMRLWNKGLVAQPGTRWHRDNQYSYTMYLATQHNRIIHEDRVDNDGMLVGRLESTEDVEDGQVEIQPRIVSAGDDDEYPAAKNFVLSDVFEEVERQNPPTVAELNVVYPDNQLWKELKANVSHTCDNLFMASPPKPDVELCDLTVMQRHAYDLIAEGREKTLFICGKAGCGKTIVALHLCERFVNKVQASAGTGRASSNFNGPTIHGSFLWGAKCSSFSSFMSPAKKQKLQNFYKDTELFIFDEINACSADMLCQIDETMKELFCAVNTNTGKRIDEPFGGKRVVFLGDPAQLRPIRAAAVYDKCVNSKVTQYKSGGAKSYFKNAQKGQAIYREYLVPKCVWLERGQRNTGLLQQIMDKLRDGEHTEKDLDRLLYNRERYPDFIAQRGIHFSNESAAMFNCRQLWDECKVLARRFYVCRAVYHVDDSNENVVRSLSSVPASEYGYAPDVLCLAEGCEVRLIMNVDTSAGLVTNSTGRVVEIIYDSGDAEAVMKGEFPPAYCVIVHFPSFRGFMSKSSPNGRYYPFTNRNLVPIYRKRFTMERIPESIRKAQVAKFCYREQFPLDLSCNLTAHRGQGQTWKNSTLSVNLGFESPRNKIPADAASIAYVACTRITKLKDLFVSPIFPSVWMQMGKSDRDVERRKHEEVLKTAAKEFARETEKYDECLDEINFKHDYSAVEQEWDDIVDDLSRETGQSLPTLMSEGDLHELKQCLREENFPVSMKPVVKERFIGIDQGIHTFSMVAIDKTSSCLPKVVGAFQMDLEAAGLFNSNGRFNVTDVLLKLEQHSPLFDWIRGPCEESASVVDKQLDSVDRVVVALEQISVKNAYSKQFGKELGMALQRQFDWNTCVVRMSQPHVHRRNGPMFKLGEEIIESCNLEPASYENLNTRIERKRRNDVSNRNGNGRSGNKRAKRRRQEIEDVEPSDTSDVSSDEESLESYQVIRRKVQNEEYKKKKAMSSAIFKYFVNASAVQQMTMQVEIDEELQVYWRNRRDVVKYDDLGDALLHSLDAVLCQSSRYRQLIPSSPTLHKNRTVVVAVLPNKVFWVSIQCVLNKFIIEDLGECNTDMKNVTFSKEQTVELIVSKLPTRLRKTLSEFESSLGFLSATSQIKIIVKQLKSYGLTDVSPKAAGALTNSTVKAMTNLCDVALPNSTLSISNNKKSGWSYSRTCKTTGRKIEIHRSSGKHLNAILSCLNWMKSNLGDFVRDRPLRIGGDGRLKFFTALREIAFDSVSTNEGEDAVVRLESIHLSPRVVQKMKLEEGQSYQASKKTLADLILIGLDGNQQYVSAISTNCRRGARNKKTDSNLSESASVGSEN
jgi:hypothetical protein